MPKFSFQLDVRDPPEQVIGAMVDFSERRPEIWPNLTARLFSVGARHLRVDRLDRPRGAHGRPDLQAGGTFELRVESHGDGSRIIQDYDRQSKTILGRCLGAIFQLSGGAPIKRTLRQVYGMPG